MDVKDFEFGDDEPVEVPATSSASSPSPQAVVHSVGNPDFAAVNRLQDGDYHPVVLIGSSASGKSALLLSLLAYMRSAPENSVGMFFGHDFYQANNSDSLEQATEFFNRTLAEFMSGTTARATRIKGKPLFIPIVLKSELLQREIKLVFMESEGEWYQPDPNSSRYYKGLRPEIERLLADYPHGISFVWVAPYSARDATQSSTSDPLSQIRTANASLQGAFQEYVAVRYQQAYDKHMMLVTKWDLYTTDSDEGTKDPDYRLDRANDKIMREYAKEFLSKNYASAYSSFAGLGELGQKTLFRYTAGAFRERTIKNPRPELQETLLSYPRDVWNWIYSGAQGSNEASGLPPGPLIPKPEPPKRTLLGSILHLWDKFTNLIFG